MKKGLLEICLTCGQVGKRIDAPNQHYLDTTFLKRQVGPHLGGHVEDRIIQDIKRCTHHQAEERLSNEDSRQDLIHVRKEPRSRIFPEKGSRPGRTRRATGGLLHRRSPFISSSTNTERKVPIGKNRPQMDWNHYTPRLTYFLRHLRGREAHPL